MPNTVTSRVASAASLPDTMVTASRPAPRKTMNTYGISAEIAKCRRRSTTRWWKITDIAFSSTVNASALNTTIDTSSTPPSAVRCARNARRSATSARRLARRDELEIFAQRRQQARFGDEVRQRRSAAGSAAERSTAACSTRPRRPAAAPGSPETTTGRFAGSAPPGGGRAPVRSSASSPPWVRSLAQCDQ